MRSIIDETSYLPTALPVAAISQISTMATYAVSPYAHVLHIFTSKVLPPVFSVACKVFWRNMLFRYEGTLRLMGIATPELVRDHFFISIQTNPSGDRLSEVCEGLVSTHSRGLSRANLVMSAGWSDRSLLFRYSYF